MRHTPPWVWPHPVASLTATLLNCNAISIFTFFLQPHEWQDLRSERAGYIGYAQLWGGWGGEPSWSREGGRADRAVAHLQRNVHVCVELRSEYVPPRGPAFEKPPPSSARSSTAARTGAIETHAQEEGKGQLNP